MVIFSITENANSATVCDIPGDIFRVKYFFQLTTHLISLSRLEPTNTKQWESVSCSRHALVEWQASTDYKSKLFATNLLVNEIIVLHCIFKVAYHYSKLNIVAFLWNKAEAIKVILPLFAQ